MIRWVAPLLGSMGCVPECHIINRQMAHTSNVDMIFHQMHVVCVSFDVFEDNSNFHRCEEKGSWI